MRKNVDAIRAAGALVRLKDNFLGGPASWVVLTLGQVLSLLACLVIVAATYQVLGGLTQVEGRLKKSRLADEPEWARLIERMDQSKRYIVLAGALAFCLSATLFVVFKRAKALARIAAAQDAENQRLWQAIEALRNRAGPAASEQG
jgi:hypothetical protein